jgi:hypothetical protein
VHRDGELVIHRPGTSPFGASRSDIARDIFGLDEAIGAVARVRISEAAQTESPEDLREMISRVGPGFHRYRLIRRLDELEGPSAR